MLKSARHLFQKRARSYPQAKMCKLFLIFTYQRVIAPKTFFHIAVTIKSVVSDYKKSKKAIFFFFLFWWKIVPSCLQLTKKRKGVEFFMIFLQLPDLFFCSKLSNFFQVWKKHGQQLQRHIAKIWQIEDSYDDEWGSSHKHFGKKQIFLFLDIKEVKQKVSL